MKNLLYIATTIVVLSLSLVWGAEMNYELAIDEAYNSNDRPAEEIMMQYGFYGEMFEEVTLEDKIEAVCNAIMQD
jgi:hypothetical protein